VANNNRKFARQIKAFGKLSAKEANKETRRLALAGLKGVITKSPVDEGTFKGNWNVGINNSDNSIDDDRDDSTPLGSFDASLFNDGSTIIGTFKNGQNIAISNNMPYGNRLEYGYSPQSKGMIRRTFEELKNYLKSRNKKV